MIKKIFLSLASAFLIWQSYELLSNIHNFEVNSLVVSIFIAWVINLFVTGIFAFLGFAYPTQKMLPKYYYQIHNSKILKATYDALKVNLFRKFLLATFWRNRNQRKKFFNGKRSGVSTLVEQSMKSEFGHLLPFLIINIVGIYLFAINFYELGFFTLIINIIGNMYPIILQRHHRMRIQFINKRNNQLKQSFKTS